jgi:hypothetical protein
MCRLCTQKSQSFKLYNEHVFGRNKKELVDIQKSNPYTHDDMDEIVRGYLF